MANQEHLEILRQGVEVWNQWREEHPEVLPDLSEADLSHVNLSHANLQHADLRKANLWLANLQHADLRKANLSGADLASTDLREANVTEANFNRADLASANLAGAKLRRVHLEEANLSGARLEGADLRDADLSRARLHTANLRGADLQDANLQGALLGGAELDRANLLGANFGGTSMFEFEREPLRDRGAVDLDRMNAAITNEPNKEETLTTGGTPTLHTSPKLKVAESTSTLEIRITQQPLTARNLAKTTSALTQLHTQYWLIATGRFTDLIEYAQTHNPRFDEEANLTIAQITHHSPAEIKFNVSLEGVANALRTSIDAVLGMWERKRELELKNTALEEEIRRKKQEADSTFNDERIAQQTALVELYDKRIGLRRKQLDLLDYAAQKAPEIVEALHSDADATTKAMAANTLIRGLLQLGETEGLELLLAPPNSEPPPQVS